MKLITINPNSKPYYSEDFIKGFKCGAERQFEADKADRPQGEWEIEYRGNGWNDYWDYICSNCGKKYERADAVLYKANFCPNCGAQMKGADDESVSCLRRVAEGV